MRLIHDRYRESRPTTRCYVATGQPGLKKLVFHLAPIRGYKYKIGKIAGISERAVKRISQIHLTVRSLSLANTCGLPYDARVAAPCLCQWLYCAVSRLRHRCRTWLGQGPDGNESSTIKRHTEMAVKRRIRPASHGLYH
jgi:hypothetical protein